MIRYILLVIVMAFLFQGSQIPNAQAAPVVANKSAPCTTSTNTCTEWVGLGGGSPARAMIYRSYPLTVRNNAIQRALIMVHGANRNADHYFGTATAAAFLAGTLDTTIIIAPLFKATDGNCKDKLEPNEVGWKCGGDSWRSGGASLTNQDLTSFDFVDELVKKLADKKIFPNLTAIVIAGHSAGGQFVMRYQMANRVQETLGVPLFYVSANPSSYAWPDPSRILPVDDGTPENAGLGWSLEDKPHTGFSFGPFDAAKVPAYDHWPYGLEDRTGGYTVKMSDDELKKQLVARSSNTTYLLSQVDTLPLGGFDKSPSAMAQGPTRRARGEAFVKYTNEQLGAKHKVIIIPECGHNDRCVYTTDIVFSTLFPK